jgi:ribosomal protein L11 methyltransferase
VLSKAEHPGRYIEVSLAVPNFIQEIVCNYIIENLASGLILEDEEDSDTLEIKFYLPKSNRLEFKKSLIQYLNSIDPEINFSESGIIIKDVPDIKWVKVFRDSIKPIYIDDIVIRPPWIRVDGKDYTDIIIEPKMAFGTGQHESTRLSIRAIRKYLKEGCSFFDLGCGNGILSILASKKKAGKIRGSDIDPIAIDNARENLVINGVEDKIELGLGSIEIAEQSGPYEFFVVNIIKETILNLYDRIDNCTGMGGIIVLSGLLREDESSITSKLKKCGRNRFEITNEGQWVAFTVFK